MTSAASARTAGSSVKIRGSFARRVMVMIKMTQPVTSDATTASIGSKRTVSQGTYSRGKDK